MRAPRRALVGVAVAAGAVGLLGAPVGAAGSGSGTPTCSDTLGIAVHGQHIVGDYVTGIGRDTISWPPKGGVVGDAVSSNGGVTIAGGPGPGFHFPMGMAPGASFCNGSNSPGMHL
jgi:hypothetical protein